MGRKRQPERIPTPVATRACVYDGVHSCASTIVADDRFVAVVAMPWHRGGQNASSTKFHHAVYLHARDGSKTFVLPLPPATSLSSTSSTTTAAAPAQPTQETAIWLGSAALCDGLLLLLADCGDCKVLFTLDAAAIFSFAEGNPALLTPFEFVAADASKISASAHAQNVLICQRREFDGKFYDTAPSVAWISTTDEAAVVDARGFVWLFTGMRRGGDTTGTVTRVVICADANVFTATLVSRGSLLFAATGVSLAVIGGAAKLALLSAEIDSLFASGSYRPPPLAVHDVGENVDLFLPADGGGGVAQFRLHRRTTQAPAQSQRMLALNAPVRMRDFSLAATDVDDDIDRESSTNNYFTRDSEGMYTYLQYVCLIEEPLLALDRQPTAMFCVLLHQQLKLVALISATMLIIDPASPEATQLIAHAVSDGNEAYDDATGCVHGTTLFVCSDTRSLSPVLQRDLASVLRTRADLPPDIRRLLDSCSESSGGACVIAVDLEKLSVDMNKKR